MADHVRSKSEQRKLKEAESRTFNNNNNNNVETKKDVIVPVVYYLSRNGLLEHPHFMELTLSSSSHGLFLRDVITRLNLLRGNRIASHYSWSSKRSYKNGYVWQDLEENDFIHPIHGGEYVLKGSEILETVSSTPSVSKPLETSSSFSAKSTPEYPPPVRNRRRNQSWGGVDQLHEYKVYKSESTHESLEASDASTQTDEKRRRRSRAVIKEEIAEEEEDSVEQSTELSREEISPPPSDSSSETLESLIKADGKLILATSSEAVDEFKPANPTAGNFPSGRMKASSVIMSIISCCSVPFRDCGVVAVKEHGMSLMSRMAARGRNPTVGGDIIIKNDDDHDDDVMGEIEKNRSIKLGEMGLENKEYFSGSLLMEKTKKDEFCSSFFKLKRSSSCNADRSSHLKMRDEKDEEEVRSNCIPRRPKRNVV